MELISNCEIHVNSLLSTDATGCIHLSEHFHEYVKYRLGHHWNRYYTCPTVLRPSLSICSSEHNDFEFCLHIQTLAFTGMLAPLCHTFWVQRDPAPSSNIFPPVSARPVYIPSHALCSNNHSLFKSYRLVFALLLLVEHIKTLNKLR